MTNNLINVATRLYTAQRKAKIDFQSTIEVWRWFFTTNELKSLWTYCQNNLDLPFDDEVYEAIKPELR